MLPGVVFRGLPEGLGALQDYKSPIATLFRKCRPADNATAIKLSVSPGYRITAEVSITPAAHEQFYEPLEIALAIKMVLMIGGHPNVEVPVALSVPLTEIDEVSDGALPVTDVDLHKGGFRFHFSPPGQPINLSENDWLWVNFIKLLYGKERDRFKLVLQAVDASRYAYEPRFALAALWVGPEAIFAKDPSEATFRLTAAWSAFVESPWAEET